MSEEEILKNDLQTIYKIIEIHAKMNSPQKDGKKQAKEEEDAYIDNIKF